MITAQVVGRITKSVELRTTNSGKTVTSFTLACKRKHPDKDGKTQTTFIQCVLWGKPAQILARYTQKGSLISAEGEIQNRNYDDQQGTTRYVTELVIESFEFLESKETVQKREEKHHGVPSIETQSTGDTTPSDVEPSAQSDYEQPPMNGLSDYGYNQY